MWTNKNLQLWNHWYILNKLSRKLLLVLIFLALILRHPVPIEDPIASFDQSQTILCLEIYAREEEQAVDQ